MRPPCPDPAFDPETPRGVPDPTFAMEAPIMPPTPSRGQDIILPPSALRALADAAAGSTPGAGAILLLAGREVGRALHPLLVEEDGGGAQRDFWDRLQRQFARRGLGVLGHRRIHPGIGLLECSGVAELEGGGAAGRPTPFTTGLLLGILSAAAGRDVDLRPLAGDASADVATSARWVFGSPAALDALERELGRGFALEEAVGRL